MAESLKGRRLDSVQEFYSADRRPGDYVLLHGSAAEGHDFRVLYICDPRGHVGRIHETNRDDGEGWTFTDHEDGTFSVTPSINDPPDGYHGYLTHGVWTPGE